MRYRNIKTGIVYIVLHFAIDVTNTGKGNMMVIYFNPEEPGIIYAREREEFYEKFEKEK